MATDDPGITRFNALRDAPARQSLRSCCASTHWVSAIVSARPFADRAALFAQAERELAALDWPALREALDAHPRIGERVGGGEPEAVWSRREQSGMARATTEVRAALLEANRAYEQRFGHVFLIFATGRTDTEMLAAARQRLGHDDETEREVVRAELNDIVALRLTRLLDEGLGEQAVPDEARPDQTQVDERQVDERRSGT